MCRIRGQRTSLNHDLEGLSSGSVQDNGFYIRGFVATLSRFSPVEIKRGFMGKQQGQWFESPQSCCERAPIARRRPRLGRVTAIRRDPLRRGVMNETGASGGVARVPADPRTAGRFRQIVQVWHQAFRLRRDLAEAGKPSRWRHPPHDPLGAVPGLPDAPVQVWV